MKEGPIIHHSSSTQKFYTAIRLLKDTFCLDEDPVIRIEMNDCIEAWLDNNFDSSFFVFNDVEKTTKLVTPFGYVEFYKKK